MIFVHNELSPVQQYMQGSLLDILPGDANIDGIVDVGDLGVLAANWSQGGRTWAQADFTGEGQVDVGDLGVLAANWGQMAPWYVPDGPGAGVPEPASVVLLATSVLMLVARRRRDK